MFEYQKCKTRILNIYLQEDDDFDAKLDYRNWNSFDDSKAKLRQCGHLLVANRYFTETEVNIWLAEKYCHGTCTVLENWHQIQRPSEEILQLFRPVIQRQKSKFVYYKECFTKHQGANRRLLRLWLVDEENLKQILESNYGFLSDCKIIVSQYLLK